MKINDLTPNKDLDQLQNFTTYFVKMQCRLIKESHYP